MRKFEKDRKLNFVDSNNVFVGFDYSSCCCEDFGYVLTTKEFCKDIHKENQFKEELLCEYVFDTKYFEESDDCDDGGVVCFRLYSEHHSEHPAVFLYLYNFHNGYYSHGFTANIGGTPWQEGHL
jgi:hypothetical protein